MERSSFPRPSSFPPQQSTEHLMANYDMNVTLIHIVSTLQS
jgi:hypothetical protein